MSSYGGAAHTAGFRELPASGPQRKRLTISKKVG